MAEKTTRAEAPAPAPSEASSDVEGTSSDARFSTYAEAPAAQHQSAGKPWPGRQVEQTRGTPSET